MVMTTERPAIEESENTMLARPTVQLPSGWIKTVDRQTGRVISVAIPSSSVPNGYHLVNRKGCDCKGFAFCQLRPKTCRHHRALMLLLETIETPAPMLPVCAICRQTHNSEAEAEAYHAERAAQALDIWGEN